MPRSAPVVLLAARVLLALLFITAGFGKISTGAAFAAAMARKGMPLAGAFPVLAVAIELGGGLVLLAGFRTRLLAVLFAVYVVVATVISHAFWAMDDPAQRAANAIHFYKNLAIIGGFLLLYVTGGGDLSLDAALGSRRRAKETHTGST
jgi:putative oxidoreductase